MPKIKNWDFIEFSVGDVYSHRIDFSIDDHEFLMTFTPVLSSGNREYLIERSKDVGFNIPDNSYDVKFDRLENFESDDFFSPPSTTFSFMCMAKLRRLGMAICQLLEFHAMAKDTEVYLASAENEGLKCFYDRLANRHAIRLEYDVIADLGEEGLDYAIKTSKFKQQN